MPCPLFWPIFGEHSHRISLQSPRLEEKSYPELSYSSSMSSHSSVFLQHPPLNSLWDPEVSPGVKRRKQLEKLSMGEKHLAEEADANRCTQQMDKTTGLAGPRGFAALVAGGSEPLTKAPFWFTSSLPLGCHHPMPIVYSMLLSVVSLHHCLYDLWKSSTLGWQRVEVGQLLPMSLLCSPKHTPF